MSNKGRLIKGSAWAIGGTLVNNLFSLVVLAVLARHLGPREFGMVAFISLAIDMTSGILLSGLPDALARQRIWDDELASSAFWANSSVGMLLMLITAAGALVLWESGSQTSAALLLTLSPSFLIEASGSCADSRMRFDLRFRDLAARQVAGTISGGILALLALFAGWGVWALLVQRLGAVSVQAILLWTMVRWKPGLRFSYSKLQPVVTYSVHLIGVNALGQVNLRSIELIIGLIGGPVALGAYQIAGRGLNMLVQVTIVPVQRVALIGFAKLQDDAAIATAYLRTTRFVSLTTFPFFLGMAAVAPDFILVVFGPQWHGATPVMVILALMVGPYTLSYFSAPALSAAGKSGALLRYSTVMTVSTILVTLVGAPLGIAWVAGLNAVRAHVLLPFSLGVLTKAIGVPRRKALMGLVPSAASACVMSLVIGFGAPYLLGGSQPAVRLLMSVSAGVVLHASLMLTFGRRVLREAIAEAGTIIPDRVRSRIVRFLR